MIDGNTLLLSGYAKLPANTTAEMVYNTLVLVVIIDKRTGVILDAEPSVVTELAKKYINDIMSGYDMNNGPEELLEIFEECYHGNAKRALETAMRMVFSKYRDYLTSKNK